MPPDPKKALARQQRYRDKKRTKGLCSWCSAPAEAEKTLCTRCLMKNRVRIRKIRGSQAWTPMQPGRPVGK